MQKYVFYDFETTGISPAFDQPLQFAAIITDENFKVIERINIRCQAAPHILPSPYALKVTKIDPEKTADKNLPTAFNLAQTLQRYTEDLAPACWIGYNSIAFDETMMRQMFYQNLQPEIFATQINGNSRLDVMKMVFATYSEAPGVLTWPVSDNGNTSFKLDRLAPANGFAHENAHDALADVEATIFIFKKIRDGAPELFKKLVDAGDKTITSSSLKSFLPMEVTLRFGGNAPKTYQGCYCGSNKDNPNSIGFADFELNKAEELTQASKLYVSEAIEGTPKKIRTLAVNRSETFRVIENPSEEMLEFCETIKEANKLQSLVSEVLSERYADTEQTNLEVEERIYSGFYGNSDKELLEQFQTASWPERVSIINDFTDERLKQLGKRLIAFYAPELLTDEQRSAFKAFIQKRWNTSIDQAEWTTAEHVWDSIGKIKSEIDENKWRAFYEAKIENFSAL
jgi:exodeoxyribonuclease-1